VGAQGNIPFDRGSADRPPKTPEQEKRFHAIVYSLLGAPWAGESDERLRAMSTGELVDAFAAVPPGVLVRQGASVFHPPKVPDLIGIRDRKFLDATGIARHREPGDMMRYAAVNQGMDLLASYKDFIPAGKDFRERPEPDKALFFGRRMERYSDEQLYALSLFLYSLKPPPNPNRYDKTVLARGERHFIEQGCVTCHTPPLYTNNMLTPVDSFAPPEEHYELYDIFDISVGTDPAPALTTRRGTGYYKVPSLLGLWYRGPFLHDGSLATLEELLDPARLREDYVPGGFKGVGVKTRAVPGHPFGLELSAHEKADLIAYLKSL
jgi:hypothetical protein